MKKTKVIRMNTLTCEKLCVCIKKVLTRTSENHNFIKLINVF